MFLDEKNDSGSHGRLYSILTFYVVGGYVRAGQVCPLPASPLSNSAAMIEQAIDNRKP
jgi:hypothetical protein